MSPPRPVGSLSHPVKVSHPQRREPLGSAARPIQHVHFYECSHDHAKRTSHDSKSSHTDSYEASPPKRHSDSRPKADSAHGSRQSSPAKYIYDASTGMFIRDTGPEFRASGEKVMKQWLDGIEKWLDKKSGN